MAAFAVPACCSVLADQQWTETGQVVLCDGDPLVGQGRTLFGRLPCFLAFSRCISHATDVAP